MKLLIITGVVLICCGIALWWYGPRMIKTVWLIMRVSPHEQIVDNAPTILILGDSTGYGTGASRTSDTIAGRIGSDFPTYSIENDSINGRTIGDLVHTTKGMADEYTLILLQIGANDILQDRPLETVEAELRTIVSRLEGITEHLVMISSGNVGGASAFSKTEAQRYEQRSREFKAMFARVAADTELVYVDLFIEPEVDPFILWPSTYLAIDGLHPSSAGYGLWYATLEPVLAARLE